MDLTEYDELCNYLLRAKSLSDLHKQLNENQSQCLATGPVGPVFTGPPLAPSYTICIRVYCSTGPLSLYVRLNRVTPNLVARALKVHTI